MKELCRDDLIGRNADHTFTETVIGDMTLVEFKDSGGSLIARAKKMSLDEAYDSIREQMGLGREVPPQITTVQRDALAIPGSVGIIANTTTRALEVYIGGSWR